MVYLRSFGKYLPSRIVTNEEIGAQLGVEPTWIERVSGIRERRFAAADETALDMGVRAAMDCIERSALRADEIGFVLVASGTMKDRFPGFAAPLSHRLGITGVPAIDLPMASAGSLFALCLSTHLVPTYRNVLIVAAEKMSEVVGNSRIEPGTAALFGDGAGACLVSSAGIAELRSFTLHSDGSFADDLRLDFTGHLVMNGRSVILQASRKLPRAIEEVLSREGLSIGSVGTFILHQANQNLLATVARALNVPESRFYSNIRSCGNTSSASLLIAAAEWFQSFGFNPGEPVMFAAFGAGFHWGALAAVSTR